MISICCRCYLLQVVNSLYQPFSVSSLVQYDTDCLQVVTTVTTVITVTKGKEMLEMLKRAEEGVKTFNSLPKEQRYYYDDEDKEVIYVETIEAISLNGNISYKFKGYVIDDENRGWFNFFNGTFKFVTKREAIEQAKQDESKVKKEITRLRRLVKQTQRKIQDLEEELEK